MSTRSKALFSSVESDVGHLIHGLSVDELPPDLTYRSFAAQRLRQGLLLKFLPDSSSELDKLCLAKFNSCNLKCLNWDLGEIDEKSHIIISEMKRIIDDFLHPSHDMLFSSYFDILKYGRVGPGSAIGAGSTSLYAKLFSSSITATRTDLYTLYSNYVEWFTLWDEAERQRRSKYKDLTIVNGSRCRFVPKSSKISRMICVEPSLNMFYQLGLGTLLEDRLSSHFNSDLSKLPSINIRLAHAGSKDDSYCTIDLASASDSVSIRLCEFLFPSWFFKTLMELRSPKMEVNGSFVPLFMISTMGNGFTFPLQTLIFSSLIRATYHFHGIEIHDDAVQRNWSCFGDDLIVDKRVYHTIVKVLEQLGFSVNSSKSFFEGPFRESCGADFFRGQPVRPVYIRKLDTPQDLFVAINLLNRWSSLTGIPLSRSIRLLLDWLPKRFLTFLVPFGESDDAGIKVPSMLLSCPKRDPNGSYLYRYFSPKSFSYNFEDGRVIRPLKVRNLIYNPSGLYTSLLRGELRHGQILIRHNKVPYRVKRRCSPNWDYIPPKVFDGKTPVWRQWETAVYINLYNP